MGVSTNGQICYGIMFDEDTKFPWDDEKYEGDIDNWWLYGVVGFKPSFEIYSDDDDDDNTYVDGKQPSDEVFSAYFGEIHEARKVNPTPASVINYCSDNVPMYILAVPSTVNQARRGYPEVFEPSDLVVTDAQKTALIEFCKAHGIGVGGEPAWYLSSYWG